MFLENTVNPKEQFGWIEVICGSMFSGKTEELIRRLKRAQFAKQKVEIFKPNVDVFLKKTRRGQGRIRQGEGGGGWGAWRERFS